MIRSYLFLVLPANPLRHRYPCSGQIIADSKPQHLNFICIWNDRCCNKVNKQPGSCAAEYGKQQTDDRRIHAEILAKSAAYSTDHSVFS